MLLLGLGVSAAEPIITLPIRFHLTQGAAMTVKGQVMENWVKPEDLTGPVLAEVNRIWKPAGIQFVVERAQPEALLKPKDFKELLAAVENSKRGEAPRSSPTASHRAERLPLALYRRDLSGLCESRRQPGGRWRLDG
jgi:hypothetical protein